MFYYKVKTSSY